MIPMLNIVAWTAGCPARASGRLNSIPSSYDLAVQKLMRAMPRRTFSLAASLACKEAFSLLRRRRSV